MCVILCKCLLVFSSCNIVYICVEYCVHSWVPCIEHMLLGLCYASPFFFLSFFNSGHMSSKKYMRNGQLFYHENIGSKQIFLFLIKIYLKLFSNNVKSVDSVFCFLIYFSFKKWPIFLYRYCYLLLSIFMCVGYDQSIVIFLFRNVKKSCFLKGKNIEFDLIEENILLQRLDFLT